jgi:protein SCO1/2
VSRYLGLLITVVVLSLSSACSTGKRYPLTGQVLSVNAERQELTVKHEDIRGFMPAMTMPFKVRSQEEFGRWKPGDVIQATLVVEETTGYLEDITKTGEAPLPEPSAETLAARMIEPGALVPDAQFTDQNGRPRSVSDWRGQTIAVTFVYTRCPLPNFCPQMDRHFVAVQKALKDDPALAARVHLVSVSFDPDYDTPEVLRAHAKKLGVDPTQWSYVTGSRESVDPFAAAFGVSIMRDDKPLQEIVHNLRTPVIDREGRLSEVLGGNEWTPQELLAAIRKADGRR